MNWQHLGTFLWLRWRIRVNQLRRGGTANMVIVAILAVAGVLFAGSMFIGLFFAGMFGLAKSSPWVVMYVWDGVVVAFLFIWLVSLLSDLQRSEVLSLDKFLHLPVSLTGAFLINYLSSLVSVCLVLFVPAMVGLSLGLVLGKGPALLAVLPLLAGFLLAVTAVTYQFQGWLAAIMTNPRRRRTVIFVVTAAFILLVQLPNLINLMRPWDKGKHDAVAEQKSDEQAELQQALGAGKITHAEYEQRQKDLLAAQKNRQRELDEQTAQHAEQTALLLNVVLPPGWLPWGAKAAAEGNVVPALLGTLGLGLIGSASLWRAYRTTLRLYTGQFTSGKRRPVAVPKAPVGTRPLPAHFLERNLPWLSEQATAITLASFRSLVRAPEAKMMLLTPIILVGVFGSMFLTRSTSPPEMTRPLIATGTMAMILLSMVQLVGNQFGFDRNGFRVFVLCAARRSDVLLGKNLAFAPLALGLGAIATVALQVIYPMRFDHFLGVPPQFVSMYLLFCFVANWLSIFAPMPIASGSLRPAQAKLVPILLQVVFTFVFPIALAPTLLPLGIEFLLGRLWPAGERLPICLVLSLVECVAVVFLYRLALTWQGGVLQAWEQKILETVTTKAE